MGAIPPSAILSRKSIALYGGVSRTGQGFPKGGFCEGGGEISIIGVVRAPVAIINFASNPCENL